MTSQSSARPKALIVGLAGTELSAAERELFRRQRPAGFILFRRNCRDRAQLRALVHALHDAVPDGHPLVFIDQEGGRVARMRPPVWPALPPLKTIGDLASRDRPAALDAARLHAELIGRELNEAGIDVVCAPVLDVAGDAMTDAIGDRAFGQDLERVAELGRAAIQGFNAFGIHPVIKHCPGHGRALVDSHKELPRVTAGRADLERVDFVPFKANRDVPFAMTAHIVYEALDADRPASQSPVVIDEIIRGVIGFEGIILTDDISMAALRGDLRERAARALEAGCDLVVHCTGDFDEMASLLETTPSVDETVAAGLLEAALRPRTIEMAGRPNYEALERHLQRLT